MTSESDTAIPQKVPSIDDISPSAAVEIEGLKGAGRLRRHDVENLHADWMVFDPELLIEVLEKYHDDEAVALAVKRGEMKAGVSAPVMVIGDIVSDNTDLSIVTGQVGGEDAEQLDEWREENAE